MLGGRVAFGVVCRTMVSPSKSPALFATGREGSAIEIPECGANAFVRSIFTYSKTSVY